MKRILFIIIAAAVLVGCRATKTVTTDHTIHADTVYISRVNDVFHVEHDSIIIYQRPDTFVKEVYRTRNLFHVKQDTVYTAKVDTVYFERVKVVEQKTVNGYFKAFLAAFALGLVLFIVGLVKSRQKG